MSLRHRLSDESLTSIIEKIYEAATDSSNWDSVMKLLGNVYGAQAVAMFSLDLKSQNVVFANCVGISDDTLADYASNYAADDVRTLRALRLPTGTVSTEGMLMTRQELRSSRVFHEFLKPLDLPHVLGVFPLRSETSLVTFSVNRSAMDGAFEEAERNFLCRLVPHMQRAAMICNKLSEAENLATIALETLEHVPFGVAILNSSAGVIATNTIARNVLESRDGIAYQQGRIAALESSCRPLFDSMVHAACSSGGGNLSREPVTLSVPRPSGLRPYDVMAVPISRTSAWRTGKEAAAMVAIFDTTRSLESLGGRARSLYSLSRAESRLVDLLVASQRPESIAETLSISVNTVRTHLKSIYRKVGVSSQAELIRVLLLGPVGLG